jgi:RNA polymerase sigma-70 factor (ECF subfamily)
VAHAAYQRLRDRQPGIKEIALADVAPALDRDGRHFAPMADWSKRIDQQALEGGLRGILTEAIDALPVDYRTALILHDVERASKPDIADILGVDVPGVTLRVHRARLFVRRRLAESFDSPPGRE